MPETLVVQAALAELARVSAWATALAERCAVPTSTAYAVNLCLEEAVSNVIRHGSPGDAGIGLSWNCQDGRLYVTIEDHGPEFDPRMVATPVAPASLNEAPIGGLGIHLMRQFATEMSYERRNGVNRLLFRFDSPPP
jgi:serine/threonine-protein kinase RsbW